MTRVIYADSEVGMSAAFGRPSNQLQAHLRNQVDQFVQRNALFNPNLVQRVKTQFQNFSTGAFARKVQAVRGRISHHFKLDTQIRQLKDISDIQNAPGAMLPFIMAMPELKRMYNHNQIDGYGDRFTKLDDRVGWNDYNYRRLMSGVVHDTEINGQTRACSRQYIESTQEDYDLTIHDKDAILRTHELIRELLRDGVIDPTSSDNELIG